MDLVLVKKQALTRTEFERLAAVPAEEEWLTNITNGKTQRAYKNDVRKFIAYAGLHDYGDCARLPEPISSTGAETWNAIH